MNRIRRSKVELKWKLCAQLLNLWSPFSCAREKGDHNMGAENCEVKLVK